MRTPLPAATIMAETIRVRRQLSWAGLRPRQSRFENSEQAFLLLSNGLFRIELSFQGQPRSRIGQAKNSLPVLELQQGHLDFAAINHILILHENRRIATLG